MNFLAHFYISSHSEQLLLGSFIADFVRGDQLPAYSESIQQGVFLHRAMDSFTDRHPQVKKSKRILWGRHRHYSSVIVDIFYDHFLAKNWQDYSDTSLGDFASRVYATLHDHDALLPGKARRALRYMRFNDSLVSYSVLDGIERAMRGMARRASFRSQMARATDDLRLHYDQFEKDFREFFPELANRSREYLSENVSVTE